MMHTGQMSTAVEQPRISVGPREACLKKAQAFRWKVTSSVLVGLEKRSGGL